MPFIGKHVTEERILRAEEMFEQYGIWVVAVGRLFAGIRGAMVVAAGAIRFNFIKFVIADGLAALVSGGLFVWLGYCAGKKLGSIARCARRSRTTSTGSSSGIGVAGRRRSSSTSGGARKRHKPLLADVALEKVVEQVHEKRAQAQRSSHRRRRPRRRREVAAPLVDAS